MWEGVSGAIGVGEEWGKAGQRDGGTEGWGVETEQGGGKRRKENGVQSREVQRPRRGISLAAEVCSYQLTSSSVFQKLPGFLI